MAQDAPSTRLKITGDGRTERPTDGRTNERTDGRTDTFSYRYAKTHLKIIWNMKLCYLKDNSKTSTSADR